MQTALLFPQGSWSLTTKVRLGNCAATSIYIDVGCENGGTRLIARRQPPVRKETCLKLADENAALKAEIEALHSRVAELELLADTDTLTPLSNRRAFVRRLEHAIMDAGRHATPIALIFIDLNSMKAVNDTHGHLAGDAVLIHVATHLQKSLRATDMVARIGGDEFGLILNHAQAADVITRMERLQRELEAAPVDYDGNRFPVGLAWGVTMITGTDTVESALARADTAMYSSKGAQRSRK